MTSANRSERAVRTRSGIRQLRGAETADTGAVDALDAKVQLLREEGNTQASPAAPTGSRVIESTSGSRRNRPWGCRATDLRARIGSRANNGPRRDVTNYGAGIDASAELADDGEDFIVAPAGVQGGLDDGVGSAVLRISGSVGEVVETAAVSGS